MEEKLWNRWFMNFTVNCVDRYWSNIMHSQNLGHTLNFLESKSFLNYYITNNVCAFLSLLKKRSFVLQWSTGQQTRYTYTKRKHNHLGGGPVVRAWDQEVCSLCGLKFEPCGCSYDGHWRLTWSLTSGPVRLVEVRASWPGHPR
jgi:hypothetical protein